MVTDEQKRERLALPEDVKGSDSATELETNDKPLSNTDCEEDHCRHQALSDLFCNKNVLHVFH